MPAYYQTSEAHVPVMGFVMSVGRTELQSTLVHQTATLQLP